MSDPHPGGDSGSPPDHDPERAGTGTGPAAGSRGAQSGATAPDGAGISGAGISGAESRPTGAGGAVAGGAGSRGAAGDGAVGPALDARRARAERAIRGTLSGALILEAIMVLFVPRTIAPLGGGGLTGGRLAFLLGLAAALIVASVLQRRRAGLILATALQVPVIATGYLVAVMYVLGLLFAGVWIYLLRIRQDVLGPGRPPAPS